MFNSETIYKCGDFEYRLIRDFIKWPDGVTRQVCEVCIKNGEVFLAVRDKEMPIAVFDMEGNFKRAFGSELKFTRTHGLFVTDSGDLYVCDDGRHVVYKMDIYGKLIKTMGTLDKPCDNGYDPTVPWPHDLYTIKRAGEPFNRPTRMIVAPNGDLYCTDGYGNDSVHRFTADGELIRTWGGPGDGDGQFRCPHSLWYGKDGQIWACDREGLRVQIFDAEGNFVDKTMRLEQPSDCWSDGTYMYIAELEGRISIFTLDNELVAQVGYLGSPLKGHSIGGDENGNLYIGLLSGPHSVYKLERIK